MLIYERSLCMGTKRYACVTADRKREERSKSEHRTVYTRQATLTTSSDLKEQWVCNIVASIRHHLKDVKKGWFNLEEVSGWWHVTAVCIPINKLLQCLRAAVGFGTYGIFACFRGRILPPLQSYWNLPCLRPWTSFRR